MCCLYSHQVRRSNDERDPARNIKPVNNVWSSYFYAVDEESVLRFLPQRNTRLLREGKEKMQSPRAECGWREYGERFMCSLCPSLPVFTAAGKGASLPSIKCQADHIDAPPSPQQSLISEQTPTLQRTANSVREAGEVLAASLLWLAERSRQSYPRSLFSSMSSVGGEARCKKKSFFTSH